MKQTLFHLENGGGSGGGSREGKNRRPSQMIRSTTWMLIVICSSILTFYAGVWTGVHASGSKQPETDEIKVNVLNNVPCLSGEDFRRLVVEHAKLMVQSQYYDLCKNITSNGGGSQLFSTSISHFAQGLARVSNVDLMETIDFGVPINQFSEGLDALILYNNKKALPSDKRLKSAVRHEDPTRPLPLLSAKLATESCDVMNVVMMDNPDDGVSQCFALIGGQYRNYHIQHWMRRQEDYGGLDTSMPLKLTSRGWTFAGRQDMPAPTSIEAQMHQLRLRTYFNEIDGIKSRLHQTLEKFKTETIVIMTCNFGQSELLMNFVCSARARGFDLHNLLVFPTDEETRDLAKGLGLEIFYEEKLMALIPKKESINYGDPVFSAVMFAKVLCVQLVNELGYDVLFQDVDIVWYKDPLDFFHNKSLPKFDMYFQDDGNRQDRFAPYSANTGFYFVRSNDRTRNLFRQFLYTSDLISAWKSHQALLIALMAEHNSAFGLTVKVYPKELEEFPGGLHFHRQKEMMKRIMGGVSKAYIFHMSWTENKIDKLRFLKQMGEWYVHDQCVGKKAHEILGPVPDDGSLSKCCSAEPIITCYYRDKPSKIPCPDAPIRVPGSASFW